MNKKSISVFFDEADQAALRAAALPGETTSDTIRRAIREARIPRTVAVEVRSARLGGWRRQFVVSPAEADSRARVFEARGLEVRLVEVPHVDPGPPVDLGGAAAQAARHNQLHGLEGDE